MAKLLDFDNVISLSWDASAMDNVDFEYYQIETLSENDDEWIYVYRTFGNRIYLPKAKYRVWAFYGNHCGDYENINVKDINSERED